MHRATVARMWGVYIAIVFFVVLFGAVIVSAIGERAARRERWRLRAGHAQDD